MSLGHELAPDLDRHIAARKCRALIVVIAEPDTRHHARGVADEQRIARLLAGAGLAGHRPAIKRCPLAGANFDRGVQHVVHFSDDIGLDHPARAGGHSVIKHLAISGFDAGDDVGDHPDAAIGEGRVAGGQFQQRDLLRTERDRRYREERRGNAHAHRRLDDFFRSDIVGEQRRDGIARFRQGFAQRHRPAILAVGIFRLPAVDVDRRILGDGIGRIALLHAGKIDEGLEGRARLPPCGDRAVELALLVIDTANQGADRSVDIHGDERALRESFVRTVLRNGFLDVELSFLLEVPVDRRVDDHVLLDLAEIRGHQAFHPVGNVGFGARHLGADGLVGVDRRGFGFGGRDIPPFGHGVEHQRLAGLHGGRVALRVEPRWRLQRAGEDRRFAERQVARRFAEITLRGGLDAIGFVPKEHAVEIEFENVVLGVGLLEPDGEQGFLHLASERLVGGEEEVFRHLLRYGRGAARDFAGLHAFERHRSEAQHIDAEVLAEAAILDGDEGGRNVVGQFAQRHGFAARLAAIGDQLAVRRDNADIGSPVGHLPGGRGRQLHTVIEHHAADGEGAPDAEDEQPGNQLPDDASEGQRLFLTAATAAFG